MNNITLPYSDTLSVDFTDEAWFNATEIAKNFGKKTNEWLRLDSTKEYISCLEQMLPKRENPASIKNQFVRTEKGGNNGGGCSWFHPKIAIAFARWLDVRFAIWCDMQIEKILHPVQYGLKQLPPSPYISEPEAAQFMKSIQAHCKSSGGKYSALYKKVYDYYGITSYKHIPAGKLEEAARLCGMRLLKLVKSKIPDEIPLLTFTQDELDNLIAERIKAIEGEVMPKEQTIANSDLVNILTGRVKALESELSALKEDLRPNITGDLNPSGKQRPLWLYSITDAGHQRYQPIDSDCLCMTEEHFIRHLRNSGHIVVKKDKINVGNLVLEHIPYKLLPYMVEVAAQQIGRVEAGKSQA